MNKIDKIEGIEVIEYHLQKSQKSLPATVQDLPEVIGNPQEACGVDHEETSLY